MNLTLRLSLRQTVGPSFAAEPETEALPANDGLRLGAVAQLGERLLCKQEVTGSIPVGSTRRYFAPSAF